MFRYHSIKVINWRILMKSLVRQCLLRKIEPILIIAGLISNSHIVLANDSEELEELRGLVEELNQKVKKLERKSEIKEQAAELKKKETPVPKASDKGFV